MSNIAVKILINLKNIKYNFLIKENIFFFIIIALTFSLDRFSKIYIIKNYNSHIKFINDYVNIDLIWNTGIGFGFLSTNSIILYHLITLLIGIVILSLTYVSIMSRGMDKFIFCTIIGGALGNFYDRLTFQAVPDFIDLHFRDLHWFTFNIADIFISVGILAFILKSFFVNN